MIIQLSCNFEVILMFLTIKVYGQKTFAETEEKKNRRITIAASAVLPNQLKKTRGSGCGQPQAGSALNEVLKSNFNDVDYNVSTQSEVTDYFMKKDLFKP